MPSSGSYSYSAITSNSSLNKPWDTNISSGVYYLFGSGGKDLVISTPPYPDANSSVFNQIPWLQTGVTFTLSISGVTASSTIPTNSVTFYYGTNGDSDGNVGDFNLTASPAPEPASLGLMGLGGVALLMKKRKKA
ncbi:MAG TPA: PEP-CTERM sorting domain-containing protein [Phycisphaerae bacterium]|nr:PEP-CTERM sorting domain-containing protein [Phycisphaerae bacterium]